jgi:hypothetical protein
LFSAAPALSIACALACWAVPAAAAGNPNLSVIGQPFARWADDAGDPSRKRWVLDAGETEFVLDADLNPYAKGWVTIAAGEEGFALEEGFFEMLRGLPGNLALKGGRYRAGFGRLNPAHPHTYPFAGRFRVLSAFLPGEESFNETGLQASWRFALPRDASVTASADWLQGDSFRIPRESSGAPNDPVELDPAGDPDRSEEPRPAALGRLALFAPLGERNGVELGLSGTRGVNNVAAGTRTTVIGTDVKAKLWRGPNAYLLVQGELLRLDREQAGWDETFAAYTKPGIERNGGYLFADWNWDRRYNAGASFERWQAADAGGASDTAFGVFAGLALMEETTAFRLSWERWMPGRPEGARENPDAVNVLTLRGIWSMGPHKAHQF